MVGFEWPLGRNTDISSLLICQLCQLHAKLFKMKRRDFLVEMLRQNIDLVVIIVAICPKLDLREHLIGEACRHHKTWMSGCATQVHQAALRKDDDLLSVWELNEIGSWLHFGPAIV